MKKLIILTILSLCFVFGVIDTAAQVKMRVHFPAGTHGTTVKGAVRGYAYHDYVLGASAGQTIELKLDGSGIATVFSVFLPNGDNLDAAAESDDFSGELPVKGDYVVRVLMMRSAARRKGSISNYTLKISVK